MRTVSLILSTILACSLACAAMAKDIPPPKTLHAGFDLSSSNPLVESKPYAMQAGEYVRKEITKLVPGDRLHMNMFGSLELENSLKSFNAQVTRRVKAEAIGNSAKRLIASLADGSFETQNETNILFYLEFTDFNCDAGDRIIVVTDGIEFSSDINDPKALLEKGTGLPEPDAGYLEGCSVVFYGLGKTDKGSLPLSYVKNLNKAWKAYFKVAGADFKAIVNVN